MFGFSKSLTNCVFNFHTTIVFHNDNTFCRFYQPFDVAFLKLRIVPANDD